MMIKKSTGHKFAENLLKNKKSMKRGIEIFYS